MTLGHFEGRRFDGLIDMVVEERDRSTICFDSLGKPGRFIGDLQRSEAWALVGAGRVEH